MKEVLLQGWILQIVLTLLVQGAVFFSIKGNRHIGRFLGMTGVYLIPIAGTVFVLLVAAQAFRSVPSTWASNESVFDMLAEGYEQH